MHNKISPPRFDGDCSVNQQTAVNKERHMPETLEAPDTQVDSTVDSTVEAPEASAPADERFNIQFPSGRTFTTLQGVHTKGKAKGHPRVNFDLDLSKADPFAELRSEVGLENWNRELASMIRSKCADATSDAIAENKEGLLEDTVWAKKFLEQWVPSTRRSGVGVKELRAKMAGIFNELNPLLIKQTKTPTQMTATETNRLLTLLADYSDLNEKVEERSRKGKGKKAAATK